MTLDYVALAILVAVVLILFYGVIVIHDIPYEIAKKRNHPHQDAIHYAGWVSLFTCILWPLLWIWATLWREDRGWGMQKLPKNRAGCIIAWNRHSSGHPSAGIKCGETACRSQYK
jgi:hypothetical protein